MRTRIYCVPASDGKHHFYMTADWKDYYLFTQNYRKGVQNYFGKGISLDEALDRSKGSRDAMVIHTMEKLPMYIRYIEKENKIAVLERTRRWERNGRGNPRTSARTEYERCAFQTAV